ncbi:MAG: non-heme iron oxygenase ferredoxin subunit [Candidatus Dormiibacterota bacterium]
MSLVRVASVDEIPENGAKHVEVGGDEIAVVRVDGNFYAVSDICSHEYYHLSEGEVDPEDLTIECPKHGSQFSLVDGRPRSLPAVLPVPVYGVRLQGDDVYVELISSGESAADEQEPAAREASA